VIQRSENLCFSPESSESLRVNCEGIRQHLQGIVSFERRVVRPPDLAHAAFAKESADLVRPESSAGTDSHVRRILRQAMDGGDHACSCV
jgi:hypothetical protein